jgi:hypothetical protein
LTQQFVSVVGVGCGYPDYRRSDNGSTSQTETGTPSADATSGAAVVDHGETPIAISSHSGKF